MKGKIRNTALFVFSGYLVLSAMHFFLSLMQHICQRHLERRNRPFLLFDKWKYSEDIGGLPKYKKFKEINTDKPCYFLSHSCPTNEKCSLATTNEKYDYEKSFIFKAS